MKRRSCSSWFVYIWLNIVCCGLSWVIDVLWLRPKAIVLEVIEFRLTKTKMDMMYIPLPRFQIPILYVHGGGFIAVNRILMRPYLYFLVQAGYLVYNMDYPLDKYPVAVESVLAAIQFISRSHNRIHLIGDSAGATLILMAAMRSQENIQSLTLCYPLVKTATLQEYALSQKHPLLKRLAISVLQEYGEGVQPLDHVFADKLQNVKDLPIMIHVGNKDFLHQSNQELRARLGTELNS